MSTNTGFFRALTAVLAFFIVFFNVNAYAQIAGTVKGEEKQNYLRGLDFVDDFSEAAKSTLKKHRVDLDIFASVLQGYDNNVNLDPDRLKDGFLETSANAEVTYNYTGDLRLNFENDTTNILYYNVNSANMFDVFDKIGMELDLAEDAITIAGHYALDYVLFTCDQDGTYFGHIANTSIRSQITDNIYHRFSYNFINKRFTNDKTIGPDRTRNSKLLRDIRNSLEYDAGITLDKAVIRGSLRLFRNDSNYQWEDYYDYWSFRIRPSVIYMFSDDVYASGSFIYQQRRYDDRLSSKNDEHVVDKTVTYNFSVLCDITKALTFAFNFSYRENYSNEPLQKYSGLILSSGFYYTF